MENQDFYPILFKRKSVRKFKMETLPPEMQEKIREYGSQIKGMFPQIKVEIAYRNAGEIKDIMAIKAPHYALLYSEIKDHYLMNAGFILEQLDLFLSSNGIGACWLGVAKPPKGLQSKGGLQFVIMLAFGAPAEPLHRQDVSEFKRKPVSGISNCQQGDALLESLRLAPSASNSQPWYFHSEGNALVMSRQKLNLLKAKLYDKMNQIDMGIVSTFADAALRREGKNPRFYVSPDREERVKDGYEYMLTCEWEESSQV